MITVVCSSQYPLDNFKEEILKSSGLHNKIEFLGYENKGQFSLTEIYNRGLKEAKYNHIVFLHHDLTIETKQWGVKLLRLFEKSPEFGIIGVAGSKNMPVSGQWWENRKKMYGRVKHTHEGRTWLSTYSDDLGQNIEEVSNVDGVFFAIDKTKIKKNFNEDFKGFHFYDVSFSFENYLAGVKVGVTTAIRVNHLSIGITNDAWEQNRVQFAEMHKDVLPIDIKRGNKSGKLKILLGSVMFNQNSIKEQVMLNLAIDLKKKGHNVTIISNVGGPLMIKAKKNNISVVSVQEPPGFKLGDGKWSLQTPNGLVPSQEKTLYRIKEINFDIIHVFDDVLIDHFQKIYVDNQLINTTFLDGLFVDTTPNEKVVKTINMKSNVNEINSDNILNVYNEIL
jgi:hypothetical protein